MNEETQAAKQTALDTPASFGFWLYLLTDSMLFACLFATYVVLNENTVGGPSGKELFDLPFVLVETLILLTSSFICGLTMVAVRHNDKMKVLLGLLGVMALGMAFLGMELFEFSQLASEGNSWQESGFLSAFFTLVGTHGAHIAAGLVWAGVMVWWLLRRGLTKGAGRRLLLFGMFWHFLDVIWIFIFTVVYLTGVLV